jgi:hypothetical protein
MRRATDHRAVGVEPALRDVDRCWQRCQVMYTTAKNCYRSGRDEPELQQIFTLQQ